MKLCTAGEAEARGYWRGELSGSDWGIDGSTYLAFIVVDHKGKRGAIGNYV